jgi:putative hemolysin
MDPQTTNNTNDEITQLSSIKPKNQVNPSNQNGTPPVPSKDNEMPHNVPQLTPDEPSKTPTNTPSPINSIGAEEESKKDWEARGALGSLVSDQPQNQEKTKVPEQPTIPNQENLQEKEAEKIGNSPTQAKEDNQPKTIPPIQPPAPQDNIPNPDQLGSIVDKQDANKSKKEGSKSITIIIILFVAIAVLSLGGFLIYKNYSDQEVIATFEECMSAQGSTIEQSYPPVCIDKDGTRYIAEVPLVEEPEVEEPEIPNQVTEPESEKTLAEQCYDQVSNVECPEGTQCMTNPASSFCECMGGRVDIRVSETGDQYGACLIGGSEYDEWEYFRMNTPDTQQSGSETGSPFGEISNLEYTLEKSEGTCTTDSQCVWENQGCGGGHGVCTNDPDKYKDMLTTCEVDPEFPANLGYTCGCVETIGKCGWIK